MKAYHIGTLVSMPVTEAVENRLRYYSAPCAESINHSVILLRGNTACQLNFQGWPIFSCPADSLTGLRKALDVPSLKSPYLLRILEFSLSRRNESHPAC